jgi:L-2,4-diaminobutyrate decarboxylase
LIYFAPCCRKGGFMDSEFLFNLRGLNYAVDLLGEKFAPISTAELPKSIPATGIGSQNALNILAPIVLGGAAKLGQDSSLAHMDPPTPWVSWAATMWNSALNQNLLHPATSPAARQLEKAVIDWLVPFFGMSGGHMTPGSTVANLTALWAARDSLGIDTVAFGKSSHLSVAKAAHILGLKTIELPVDRFGSIELRAVSCDLSRTALVLTAGTTTTGAIDPFELIGRAAWTHVDAAWAGPLRLTKHSRLLDCIENADSVAVSSHKWFFQPKESALVFFKDVEKANAAISFGGAYLAVPNIGVLGSHGATAVPLLATFLALGKDGIAERIERCFDISCELAEFIEAYAELELLAHPKTGVVLWRPRNGDRFEEMYGKLPSGSVSIAKHENASWFRNVAANPNADLACIKESIDKAVRLSLR